MKEKDFLKCTECGNALTLVTGSYSGADWECEAGKGSGYGYHVYLDCESCGRVYPIVQYKNAGDVSVPIKEQRSFKY